MKRITKYSFIAMTLFVILVWACLGIVQPLVSSSAYVVTASLDGEPIRANLLRPLAMPGTFYIHLPDAKPARYCWFGIAYTRKSVFSPVALYKGWNDMPYIHTDQAKGVRLDTSKIEDNWKVSFASGGVHFSNGSLDVTVKDAK